MIMLMIIFAADIIIKEDYYPLYHYFQKILLYYDIYIHYYILLLLSHAPYDITPLLPLLRHYDIAPRQAPLPRSRHYSFSPLSFADMPLLLRFFAARHAPAIIIDMINSARWSIIELHIHYYAIIASEIFDKPCAMSYAIDIFAERTMPRHAAPCRH